MTHAYYAVIPTAVLMSEELSNHEKILYGHISSLFNMNGFCEATNDYFAKVMGASERSIQRWMAHLEKLGFIRREIVRDEETNEVIKRYILPGDPAALYAKKTAEPETETEPETGPESEPETEPTPHDTGDVTPHDKSPTLTTRVSPPLTSQMAQGIDSTTYSKKIYRGTHKIPRTKPKGFEYPEAFERLWSLYRVGDKWAAYKAFRKRLDEGYCTDELERVLKVEASKDFGNRHFSTTLNGDIDETLAQYERVSDIEAYGFDLSAYED